MDWACAPWGLVAAPFEPDGQVRRKRASLSERPYGIAGFRSADWVVLGGKLSV